MKHIYLPAIALALLTFVSGASSQQVPVGGGIDPVAALKEIKAKNTEILQRQETFQKALDVLQEETRQLRIYSRRS